MATPERGIQAARRATVCVWDRSKGASGQRGHGLLLSIGDGEGVVVLTCHHVIVPIAEQNLCVRIPQEDGSLGEPVPARYDAEGSNPEKDAALLRLDGATAETRPVLHRLGLDSYNGTVQATVLTHLIPDNFDAEVRASTKLDLKAPPSETWPVPKGRYRLRAFRLSRPTDARPGVSGGVAVCNGGVLGLVHFARGEGSAHAREDYLVPLDAWSDRWPPLGALIEPLVDAELRGAAEVKKASDLKVGANLVIARYRDDVYLERGLKPQADAALSQGGALIIVGRPKSGKTRLLWEILRGKPEALVIIPHANALPPLNFESSGWDDRDVIVLFDDLHRAADTAQPLRWWRRLAQTTKASCSLICTTRDGRDWNLVKDKQESLLELLGGAGIVYASRTADSGVERGEDLSPEQGRLLASELDMAEQDFSDRFDGTPGSLLLDLEDMSRRYEVLLGEHIGGVSAARLLDSGKLLHKGGQTGFTDQKLRLVAEKVRGGSRLSAEVWEALRRRTREEGFGVFDAEGGFQVYRPYLEQCVSYEPMRKEIGALIAILEEIGDAYGLIQLGASYSYDLGEEAVALECVDKALGLRKDLPEAWFAKAVQLSEMQRDEAALEAYDEALRLRTDWPEAWVNKGMVLNRLHMHDEAREAFEEAIAKNPDLPEAWLGKGVSLASIDHHLEAADAYQQAINRRLEYPPAWHNKGSELAAMGLHEEALQAYEVAIHLRPDYGLAWYSKGNALLKLDRPDEALSAYDRALAEGYDRDDDVWLGKGNALLRLGRYREAAETYEVAVQRNPNYYQAWHQMGIALDYLGSQENASAAFNRAVVLKPDSATSLNSKALVLLELGRYAEALEAVNLALVSEGNDVGILSLKGAVLHQMHRNKEALGAVNRAIQIKPKEPSLWCQKSEILQDMGRHAEARDADVHAFLLESRMDPGSP